MAIEMFNSIARLGARLGAILLVLASVGCTTQTETDDAARVESAPTVAVRAPAVAPPATLDATSTVISTATSTAPAPTLSPSPPPTFTPAPTSTPDPYVGLTIDGLTARGYGAGDLRIDEIYGVSNVFTRTLISYESDDNAGNPLRVAGFMNVPQGDGPFPVVIVNHGYVDPAVYGVLTYTTRYADALAQNGFIAIHPNLRGYGASDAGPNDFRTGFAIDVLNLAGIVARMGGQPGPLQKADPEHIGLWGHSMGGGISLRTIVVAPGTVVDIDAAVLYGAMSGDEARNHERILFFSGGARGSWPFDRVPGEADLLRLSPIHYLDRIEAAVSIHHGEFDEQVPLWWSEELCGLLVELDKAVECFTYAGQPHTFVGEGDAIFITRTVDFFNRHLRP